jgi:3-hydroxyisobutyrate dehydrogenase-like beta-hydroxyacid dehydrogenase
MRVGWLGVGAMGAPMAARAARSGHAVHAYDIAPGRAAALASAGVQPAETIAAAVTSADIVAIMVATPGELEQVLFAPGGAAGALPAGAVVVIMATAGPAAVVSAASRLAAAGVAVVDAPVSGSPVGSGRLLASACAGRLVPPRRSRTLARAEPPRSARASNPP